MTTAPQMDRPIASIGVLVAQAPISGSSGVVSTGGG
jgi:hypothetical protein